MIGKTISHYKILEKLGEGGMGVVYKAQDNKLERTVALKFLSLTSIGTDEEKKRFKREAKAAAALNHPNIAHIYEIDEAEGQTFIAMEYIEGNSLYEIVRANGGSPLPIEDTINYTIQIAEGLQAAHEKGIVHRDIKSANIIVTEKGRVKIMDFGLAKLVGRSKVTQLGTILGTASYMSPEQARGEVVDHRADIWSLGVVLYEMISGQLPFKGDYEQAVIYSILNEAPAPLTALRTGVPMELERIVNKLLEKVPESRYQHVDELPADLKTERIAFKRTSKAATSHSVVNFTKKPKSRLRFWFSILASVIMGVFLMLFVLTQFDYLKPDTRNEPKTLKKFIINLPENQELASSSCFPLGIGHPSIAISPDGTKIVYVIEQEGRTILYLHSLDAWESQAITGTEGGYHPFFSPDGAWVGFLTNNKLKKIALDGGEPFSLCDIVHPMGATWSEDGWIYFAQLQGQKLSRVSAEGGNLEDVMIGRDFAWPQALPGGKAVLFWEGQRSRNQDYGHAFVYNVVTGENKMVFEGAAMVRYSPTGHLVYGRGGALYVVPFNVERLETKGSPTLILQGVRTEPARGAVQFSLSTDGTLVYITGPNRDIMRFVWVDRTGNVTPLHLPMQSYGEFKISPDGKQLAVVFRVEKADIWIYEFARESWIRLTLEGDNYSPVWSPDGTQITFRSNRSGTWKLYRKNAEASGAVECLPQTSEEAFHHPFTWILDGRFLLFYTSREGKRELWLLANEDTLKIQPYFGKSTGTIFNSVSPDDHWIAYTSDDLGTWEVFVEEFPSSKKRWKVSLNGGEQPRWSPDGKELYYRNKAQWFLVPISTKSGFEAGKPRVLFEGPYIQVSGFSWDIHPDGKRFLVLQAQEHENPTQLRMVLNWCNEVKRLSQENQ